MNEKRLNQELSAYLDGEARDPDGVARLLQRDEEAARRYMELCKLSAHLKALPEPEVHPAFATRVLAAARESAPLRTPWYARRALPAGLAAAALAVLAAAVFFQRTPGDTYGPEVSKVLELRHQEGVMAGPYGRLLDEDLLAQADSGVVPGPETATPTLDDTDEAAIASILVLASADGEMAPQDIDTMLGSLNESEVSVFRQLLVEYANQGATI